MAQRSNTPTLPPTSPASTWTASYHFHCVGPDFDPHLLKPNNPLGRDMIRSDYLTSGCQWFLFFKGQRIRIQLQSTSPCASTIITLPSPCTATPSRRSGTYCSHTAHHNRSAAPRHDDTEPLQVARNYSSRPATRSPQPSAAARPMFV
jgi:hypothetical protein